MEEEEGGAGTKTQGGEVERFLNFRSAPASAAQARSEKIASTLRPKSESLARNAEEHPDLVSHKSLEL